MKLKSKVYQVPENILWRQENDQIVIFNENSGDPFLLDKVGSTIWGLCSEGKRVSEIIDNLNEKYDGTVRKIAKDTMKFINHLEKDNLIQERQNVS